MGARIGFLPVDDELLFTGDNAPLQLDGYEWRSRDALERLDGRLESERKQLEAKRRRLRPTASNETTYDELRRQADERLDELIAIHLAAAAFWRASVARAKSLQTFEQHVLARTVA